MKKLLILSISLILFQFGCLYSQNTKTISGYNFEEIKDRKLNDIISLERDTVEGNFSLQPGISGNGLRLDGFTTCIKGQKGNLDELRGGFSIELWIALGTYPWNWSPVYAIGEKSQGGMRMVIGPLGQVALEAFINEQWVICSSGEGVLPLYEWNHIVATYSSNDKMSVYLNGKLLNTTNIKGGFSLKEERVYPKLGDNIMIGMVDSPEKPSHLHRLFGTVEERFGLDALLDELYVYNYPMDQQSIEKKFNSVKVPKAPIAKHRLPNVKNPRTFGAYYTKLNFYPEWDNIWPVEGDPDIVVFFEKSPVKLMFWRGMRYGAGWVSENENWMTDQSVEAWNDTEGCFEHMQDRHCRFSHVRIIENTPARVVIHWRYAPVSAHNNTWNVDSKTGWECWVDEYYYIYPDATAIRRVSWKEGSLGYPRQFQESLALLQPGQNMSDLLEQEYATVANYDGKGDCQKFVENPVKVDRDTNYTIQRYNFKSVNKPFICFEPGNNMTLMQDGTLSGYYSPKGGCNHFPEGLARCDGRTALTNDRTRHILGFPISYPPIHTDNGRCYWSGLYGMGDRSINELVSLGRSWAFAPKLEVDGKSVISEGYDISRREYNITYVSKERSSVVFTINGSESSPIENIFVNIKGWKWGDNVKVLVNGKPYSGAKVGIVKGITESNLVTFIEITSKTKTQISITL